MRILHLISRFDFGGAENHVRELCNEQIALNHEVILATRNGRQIELLDKRVKFIRIHALLSNLILSQVILAIYIILRYRVNIIHGHQRLPIFAACIAGLLTGVPVIATVHGRVRHDLRSVLVRKLVKRIIFVSSRVLTVSRHYRSIKHKSAVIPNGIPLPVKLPDIKPFTIGYFSRIDSRHFEVIMHLVSAIELLNVKYPNLTLELYGDGDEMAKLILLADEENRKLKRKAIHCKGFIETMDSLNSFPELVLGVGRVAIEALARGASVIPVNYKRMGEIVNENNYEWYAKNNFVNINGQPPSQEAIYTHLNGYFEKNNEYRKTTQLLSQKINSDFCINKIAAETINIYKSLLY
ncbi:MAG: hypothetical protein PWR03_1700 [Tenuifilum sp.]|jgi:glycosyltransferase involved in cell wall biosynthesis|uniref:glycosyltransferase n=1 Tax=Tenuifilum sp. TaxID=2760880 RepID=UPI0024AAAFFF|nr:glycosyltransferase [Tenuifilum sp.]MDI3527517.1 hypothetical protein [Tenuifilum sp.]